MLNVNSRFGLTSSCRDLLVSMDTDNGKTNFTFPRLTQAVININLDSQNGIPKPELDTLSNSNDVSIPGLYTYYFPIQEQKSHINKN